MAELAAAERTVLGERPRDQPHGPVTSGRADAELREPPGARGKARRGRQRVQPGVVLAGDQVQRAAVQPRDHERAIDGQRTIDVGRAEPAGPGANGEPEAPRVLSLYRQQRAGGLERTGGPRGGEQLGLQPLGGDLR